MNREQKLSFLKDEYLFHQDVYEDFDKRIQTIKSLERYYRVGWTRQWLGLFALSVDVRCHGRRHLLGPGGGMELDAWIWRVNRDNPGPKRYLGF
jgi:hypothetical protein